jgi:type IV pilus assembly protein PilC
MPIFHYIALDQNGKEQSGQMEAANENEVLMSLRQAQLYPTQVVADNSAQAATIKKQVSKVAAKNSSSKGASVGVKTTVKPKSLMVFTRQLATLIDSGLPLLRSLTILSRQEPDAKLKSVINALAEGVQTGSTFSDALGQYPKMFNRLFINMVKAGELGGVLEVVLNRLAEYQEKAQKLKNKVVSAMAYPTVVMGVTVLIVTLLMIVVVPKFEQIFKDMQITLPWLTRMITDLSRNLAGSIFYIIAGVMAFIAIFRYYASSESGRVRIDKIKIKLPIFGDVVRKTAIARFSRTLGTLVTSGVPILQALNITKETAGNAVVSASIVKIHDAVKEGESMVAPMEASQVFPSMVISMVDVGEETGKLPEMLLKIADVYEDEVDNSVDALTSVLEPVMILFLAVVVGIIVIALFLPLMSIINKVGAGA